MTADRLCQYGARGAGELWVGEGIEAMRILVACDSFKGSLSSQAAAGSVAAGVRRVFPAAEIDFLPIADGGEGTALTLTEALGGRRHIVRVTGPYGGPVDAMFGVLPSGEAVMDMAAASGLTLTPPTGPDIMRATTYGTGQLIAAALEQGCRGIYLGIGGSATNDGGLGVAAALGVRFRDGQGRETGHAGQDLAAIREIDLSGLDPRLRDTELLVLCDVTNPLCGPTGAARIYGPQKGANAAEVAALDEGLSHLAAVVKEKLGLDLAAAPGAGAAGGLGFGLMAFLGAKLRPGIDFLLDAAGFAAKIRQVDLVITGEGRLDGQSAFGKTPAGIARRAAEFGVPTVAVAGSLSGDLSGVYAAGIRGAEAAVCAPMSLEAAMAGAEAMLANGAERLMRAIDVGMSLGSG
jgi:glycerate kinase